MKAEYPLLLESICLRNGKMPLIEGHKARIGRAFLRWWPELSPFSLKPLWDICAQNPKGVFKIRLIYNGWGIHQIEVAPYSPRHIHSLQVVHTDDIDYASKLADRSQLDALVAQKGNADEVLICRNGFVTDASYANVVFYDGKKWLTPDTPLLEGVQRTYLLANGRIQTASINIYDLPRFAKVKLINAMMLWEESPEIDISKIYSILPGK